MADSTLNNIVRNYKYAPGIATYGPEGKQGEAGINGKGCFFCTYNISVPTELTIVNKKLQNNELLSEYKTVSLNRNYQEGDIIIDSTGSVYKVSVVDLSTGLLGIDPINDKMGEFSKDTDKDYFNLTTEGRLYNQKGEGVDFIRTSAANPSSVLGASNYVQRIYTDLADTESRYNLLSYIVQSNEDRHDLNTYFNKNDQSYHIESSDPIVIDCPALTVKTTDEYTDIDEYSQVNGSNFNISMLYNIFKKFSFKILGDANLYIYIPKEYYEFLGSNLTPDLFLQTTDSNNIVKKYLLKGQEIIEDTTQVLYNISDITKGEAFIVTPKISLLGPIEVFIQESNT